MPGFRRFCKVRAGFARLFGPAFMQVESLVYLMAQASGKAFEVRDDR